MVRAVVYVNVVGMLAVALTTVAAMTVDAELNFDVVMVVALVTDAVMTFAVAVPTVDAMKSVAVLAGDVGLDAVALVTVAEMVMAVAVVTVVVEMAALAVTDAVGRIATVVWTTVAATLVAVVTVAVITADVVPPHVAWPLLGAEPPSPLPLAPFPLACAVFHALPDRSCAEIPYRNFCTRKASLRRASFRGSSKLFAD